MVFSALTAMHPGWETEKTFIEIFIADGLPVVVRLEFGVISTVPMGREAMLDLGMDLPEGQNMNFVITIGDPTKPPIDVEIYRPVLPNAQLTVGDVALGGLIPSMGLAEELVGHSGVQECFDFIKENVGICVKQHKWGKDGPLPLLPDRVIWIEANNVSRIQLLEPKIIRAKFIALSYCWGPVTPNIYLTDATTFAARKAGINYRDLPPLFQDVVDAARVLGIEYIWIDRLCIIQGSDDDFQTQAPKMGEIYGNATLTIAAAAAATENDRILVARDEKWNPANMDMNINGFGRLQLRVRRRSHPLGTEKSGGQYGKMSTRAWIWQERLLAARSVFFTPTALKFECRCYSLWEGSAKILPSNSWSSQLDNITHVAWMTLVEEFMGRGITRASDRLPAMDAVMKRIEKRTGWTPFWGLFSNLLVESLVWHAKEHGRYGRHECRMNPGRYAPTWSWASVDGPISYVSAQPLNSMDVHDPMHWDLDLRSLNETSGLIGVAGHIIFLQLTATVEPNTTYKEGAGEEEKFNYNYEVKGRNDPRGFPVRADVPLKPWNTVIQGQYFATVVRVPHGEIPPR